MVLEGATTGDDGSFYEGNTDPQDVQSSTSHAITIDVAKLARPWRMLNPFVGTLDWNEPRGRAILEHDLSAMAEVLGRAPTQPEAQASAERLAHSLYLRNQGISMALSLGLTHYMRTRASFSFSLLKFILPKNFDMNICGPLGLRGPPARLFWHVLRFNSILTIWLVPGSMLAESMAATSFAVATVKDPRLVEMRKRVEELSRSRGRMPGQEAPQRSPPSQKQPTETPWGTMDRQAQSAASVYERRGGGQPTQGQSRSSPGIRIPSWGSQRPQQQQQQQQQGADVYDDMSPTGGAFLDDFAQAPTDGGLQTDQQLDMAERRRDYETRVGERDTRPRPLQPAASADSRPPPQQQQSSGRASSEQSPTSPGNAWEKLRRNAADRVTDSTMPRSAMNRSRPGGEEDDGFSFSRNDEDQQLAKAQEQKAFDVQLERERRGEDFSSGTSGRRW